MFSKAVISYAHTKQVSGTPALGAKMSDLDLVDSILSGVPLKELNIKIPEKKKSFGDVPKTKKITRGKAEREGLYKENNSPLSENLSGVLEVRRTIECSCGYSYTTVTGIFGLYEILNRKKGTSLKSIEFPLALGLSPEAKQFYELGKVEIQEFEEKVWRCSKCQL